MLFPIALILAARPNAQLRSKRGNTLVEPRRPVDNPYMIKPTLLALAIALPGIQAAELTHVTDRKGNVTHAVRVERGALVHTRQLLGLSGGQKDKFGVSDLIGQLNDIARAYNASLDDVARLNLYLSEDSDEMRQALDFVLGHPDPWARYTLPSISMVLTELPGDTKIACDAVIAVRSDAISVERFERDAALMPKGRDILYLSGRVASGELAEATTGTMEQLFGVLDHLGSKPKDVVQVKAFIKPMSEWETVESAIEASFGDLGAPPVVYVEWTSKSRATEIELIAAAPDQRDTTETVSYFTPPGDKSSPVFSRVARIHADAVIYLSSFAGKKSESEPEAEVRTLFEKIEHYAKQAGTDLRHLAKATYYVSNDEVSAALNQLRPEFYDPLRPPAASKVQVAQAVPFLQESSAALGLSIDLVAAPAKESAPAAAEVKAEPEGEWIQLFNGENLDGWTPKIRYEEFGEDSRKTFRVEDGVMKVGYENYNDEFKDNFGHIFYKEPFSHYRLRVEHRFVGEQIADGPGWATRNSGLMLHCQDPKTMAKDQDFPVSIEAQILGGDGTNDRTTMNLCTPGCHVVMARELIKRHCTKSTSKTFHGEQWVTAEVEVRGNELVRHFVNGELVLEYSMPVLDDGDASAKPLIEAAGGAIEMTGGWISLQSESHPVEFRKVELMVLPK
ncbi:MAG: enamine deaminase RidA (YjgF/YER057c/UK114 family) [Verrucomicrobiales bacterium]